MTSNTVILSLAEYNRLRDFENSIKDGNVYVKIDGNGYTRSELFYTKDDVIDKLATKFNVANEETRLLREMLKNQRDEYELRIKKMTVKEFKHYRRTL